MRGMKSLTGSVGLLAALCTTAGAAVLPMGGLSCTGAYRGADYDGQAVFELVTAGPDGEVPPEATVRAMLPRVARAEIGALPGTLRIYGLFESDSAETVGFEVYLGRGGEGIGSIWYEGRRRDEVIIEVALEPGGFTLRHRGVTDRFTCSL